MYLSPYADGVEVNTCRISSTIKHHGNDVVLPELPWSELIVLNLEAKHEPAVSIVHLLDYHITSELPRAKEFLNGGGMGIMACQTYKNSLVKKRNSIHLVSAI